MRWRRNLVLSWINIGVSVTKCLEYFSIFGHFHQWKFARLHTNLSKKGRKCCQLLNLLSKNYQRLLRFYQSGKILPNLVTLIGFASQNLRMPAQVVQAGGKQLWVFTFQFFVCCLPLPSTTTPSICRSFSPPSSPTLCRCRCTYTVKTIPGKRRFILKGQIVQKLVVKLALYFWR